jgi:putative intracellular protease/amidase
MRILMILIPEVDQRDRSGASTVRLECAVGPYYAFRDASAEVVLASPDGGAPPMHMMSDEQQSAAAAMRRFRQDPRANDEFSDTLRLDQVFTEDFDAGFCVGAPGSIWSSEHTDTAGSLLSRLLESGKPAAVLSGGFDLAPNGAGAGVLIIAESPNASILVAQALLGAVSHLQTTPERNTP